MKYLTTDEIRQMFLDFFQSKNHMLEPGAPLVPKNDPTLLWINSGVAALKKYFDGTIKPENPRIVNAQKSIRTNDIENVGLTARHHTFFEMLGNFSIGDYFKKEAIEYAWEFLTDAKWLGLDKNLLYVSVFEDDQEAYDIWVNDIKFPAEKILKTPENFWEIGEGPSGPNSEIFFDRGEKYDPDLLGEKLFFDEIENDRYIEIWNVVFSQYDAKEGLKRSEYQELPQKNIDTGLGLERLACVIQEVPTNYDIDVFQPIIKAVSALADYPYQADYQMAYRVIADHIRTIVFALSDGALFSNESRGYVLRRILRRAVRYGKKLGIKDNFLYQLVPIVAQTMQQFYPELLNNVEIISNLVQQEEDRFNLTLHEGEHLLSEFIKATKGKEISGEIVFKLYDTYGFPWELTEEIALEHNLSIDKKGFDVLMEQQKTRARQARQTSDSMSSQSKDLLNFQEVYQFLGYESLKTEALVTGLFQDGRQVSQLDNDGVVIFDQSVFYAESGGQVADTGLIYNEDTKLEVTNVLKAINGQAMHFVKLITGSVAVGDKFTLEVDKDRRLNIMANHSSVHLLQNALHKVVGKHINQAGSFVADGYSRFDFTHFKQVTKEELEQVEALVNQAIFENHPVLISTMELAQAQKQGVIALFEDKYQNLVRVVSMADSAELCGGTHVSNTSEIGVYKIVSEEAIGSGIRRITAVTKNEAYRHLKAAEATINRLKVNLKLQNENLLEERVTQILADNRSLEKELGALKEKQLQIFVKELSLNFQKVQELDVLVAKLKDYDNNELKLMIDGLKIIKENYLIVLISESNQALSFITAASAKAIQAGYKAGDLVRKLATSLGGKGGGRPDLAQGGSNKPNNTLEAISKFSEKLGFDFSKTIK